MWNATTNNMSDMFNSFSVVVPTFDVPFPNWPHLSKDCIHNLKPDCSLSLPTHFAIA